MQAMRHRSNVRWMNNIRFNMNVSESLFFPSHSLSLFLQKHNHHHYHDQDDSIHYFAFFTFMAQSMESIVNQPKILEFLCIFFVICDYYYEVLLKVRVLFTRKIEIQIGNEPVSCFFLPFRVLQYQRFFCLHFCMKSIVITTIITVNATIAEHTKRNQNNNIVKWNKLVQCGEKTILKLSEKK